MARLRINAMSLGFAALVVVGGLTTIPITAQAEQTPPAPAGEATAGKASDGLTDAPTSITLPTGERIRMTSTEGGRAVQLVGSASTSSDPTRIRTMDVAGHYYVVPDSALPYLGRQLDLALFDVLAPPTDLTVEWAPGQSAHAVPGLALDPATGANSTGRISDPAAFGAALTQSSRATTGPLAGIRAVRPANAAPPTVRPHFPMATLTVTGLDALGVSAVSGTVSVTNVEDTQRYSGMQSFIGGTASFSVPEGKYSVEVSITTRGTDGQYVNDALLIFPELEVTGPKAELTADARDAKTVVPIPATPKVSSMEQMAITHSRVAASGSDSTTSIMMVGGSPQVVVRPTEPVTVGKFHWYTYFRMVSPKTATQPYLYDLLFPAEGAVPDKFAALAPTDTLAVVDVAYHGEGAERSIGNSRTSFMPWERFPIRMSSTATAPLQRTEYVTALPGVGWVGTAVARPEENNGTTQSPLTAYEPGQQVTDRFLVTPVVPGVDRNTVRSVGCAACRQGDSLSLNLQTWTDGAGNLVRLNPSDTTKVTVKSTLEADGVQVGETTDPVGTLKVPAKAKQLKLSLDTQLSAAWIPTTQVSTAWTWPTARPTAVLPTGRTCPEPATACAFQPLLFADYDTGVDITNTVPAGKPLTLGVTVRHQAYDPAKAVDKLSLDVSTDDGVTWKATSVKAGTGGRFSATITPVAGLISLRIHAADPGGSTLDQTVIGAVRVTK